MNKGQNTGKKNPTLKKKKNANKIDPYSKLQTYHTDLVCNVAGYIYS